MIFEPLYHLGRAKLRQAFGLLSPGDLDGEINWSEHMRSTLAGWLEYADLCATSYDKTDPEFHQWRIAVDVEIEMCGELATACKTLKSRWIGFGDDLIHALSGVGIRQKLRIFFRTRAVLASLGVSDSAIRLSRITAVSAARTLLPANDEGASTASAESARQTDAGDRSTNADDPLKEFKKYRFKLARELREHNESKDAQERSLPSYAKKRDYYYWTVLGSSPPTESDRISE